MTKEVGNNLLKKLNLGNLKIPPVAEIEMGEKGKEEEAIKIDQIDIEVEDSNQKLK